MNDYIYNLYKEAKDTNNIELMKELNENYPNNNVIKFSYSKMLIQNGNEKLGKELLLELYNTKSKKYVKSELNKIKPKKKTKNK